MTELNGHVTALSPEHLVTLSSLVHRAQLASRLGSTFGGDRHVHEVLGYKSRLEYRDFKARYYRQDIAQRLVKAYPEATWSQAPTVMEDNQVDTDTPFERDWNGLVERLDIYTILERADILNNLGQYSVLFIGLDGQSGILDQPARPIRGPHDILYITPYSEEWATIERFENNPALPTFGQASHYRINFGRSGETPRQALAVGSALVHASRIIHIAEDTLDDEIYGMSRLEGVYDRLDDLLKVVGGAAEMFWKDAKRRLVLNLQSDAQLSDPKALTDEIEEYMHGLRDFLRVQGMDVQNLAGDIVSPEHHVAVLLDLISASVGIPKRILLGSERGQLASTQDEAHWLQRVSRRQQRFAEPHLIRALIDRLVSLRALSPPAQRYTVTWANLQMLSETQQAEVALKNANALNIYASGFASSVVPEPEFRKMYLGLTEYSSYETIALVPVDAITPEPQVSALPAPPATGAQ